MGPDGGDFCLTGNELEPDGGLRTAVQISLFSDARDERDPGDPRGWCLGELGYGSRLWLLSRAKQTPDVLVQAEDYAREALAWMIEIGLAQNVQVRASFPTSTPGLLYLDVSIERGANRRWSHIWEAAGSIRIEGPGLLVELSSAA